MLTKEYIESDGKIFKVVGRDGQGRPVTVVTDLKEIPKDEPLPKPTFVDAVEVEETPKRRRRKA